METKNFYLLKTTFVCSATVCLKEMLEMSSIEIKTLFHSMLHIIEHILEDVGCYLLDTLDNCYL